MLSLDVVPWPTWFAVMKIMEKGGRAGCIIA